MVEYDAAPRRSTPEQIGRYLVEERIGRGAMGVVYRARDEVMGRHVAIKLLGADLEDEPEIRARFLREATWTSRLTHPNIITIFDVGEDHDRLYLVMELLRGATLKEYLKTETTSLDRKLDLMIQLCAGLAAAHAAGVYHRDIKPGNIFVRTDGFLKILDFGIARLASSSMTTAGLVVGTPDYMSPEQARGGEVDARSDIFSAGSVFYFMLSGRKPFAAKDMPSIFRQVVHEDPLALDPADAPPELARLVMKAMSKDPASRHQSSQELMADLKELRSEYTTVARQVTTPRPTQPEGGKVTTGVGRAESGEIAEASEQPSTSDTVTLVYSVTSEETDDTVTVILPPPDEDVTARAGSSVTDRVGSLLTGAIERIKQTSTQYVHARRQGAKRKG